MQPQKPLCPTCRHWEWRRYLLAGKWAQSPGCFKHVRGFPELRECRDYEREPGSDDE